jgi:hypothetical protein
MVFVSFWKYLLQISIICSLLSLTHIICETIQYSSLTISRSMPPTNFFLEILMFYSIYFKLPHHKNIARFINIAFIFPELSPPLNFPYLFYNFLTSSWIYFKFQVYVHYQYLHHNYVIDFDIFLCLGSHDYFHFENCCRYSF